MTERVALPENVSNQDLRDLRAHIGKRIAFNAGRARLVGTLLAIDLWLNLKIRVDTGREAGIHRLRLGRMANYALLDDSEDTSEPPKKSR